MNYCKKCNIKIGDEKKICPLCHNVITVEEANQSNVYPLVYKKVQIRSVLIKIVLFLSIISEIILGLIDFVCNDKFTFSIITWWCLLYAFFGVYYILLRRTNHIRKIYVIWLITVIFAGVIDYFTVRNGWSIYVGIPIIHILGNILTAILMIVRFSSWENYVLLQVFAVITSIVYIIVLKVLCVSVSIVAVSGMLFSVCVLLFCLLFGFQKTKNELKKRFNM